MLEFAVGGNLLSKTTREALKIIENKSKVRYSRNKPNVSRMNSTSRENASKTDDRIDKLADQILTLVDIFAKKVITPAPVKAVEESCVTCGYNCLNTDSNQSSVYVATDTYNQVAPQNRASNYMAPPGFAPVQNSQNRFNQNQGQGNNFNRGNNFLAMLLKNLPEKHGDPGKFLIPCDFSRMDVCHALADLGASINLMPLSIWKKLSLPDLTPTWMTQELVDRSITRPKGVAEDVFVKMRKFHFLTGFVVVDFEADHRVPLILGRSFLRTGRVLIDVYEEEITLWVNDEAVTFNLNQTTRYSETYDDLSVNRIDIIDVAREDDFILEEIKAYLKGESISPEINHADCDPEGDICLIKNLLNNDQFQLPSIDLKQGEVVKAKSSIKEPSELKELPSHLKYAYLEGVDKLPVIIAKYLKVDEKEALLKVLKSHKRAIAWKITDINGIDPQFCTRKILMEEDYKPVVQSQRWVNPKIHEVIKKEVIKLLDAVMIYPISDSPWVSPIHCIPTKCGITVIKNENNKFIPTRLEVDRAKVDVIAKLPHLPTVKGVRSFLGHAGFYRQFVQDFSKIARPMTYLLEKYTPFVFSKDRIDAFETLKKKLTESPILVVPDWNLPFELMCDASNFAIGAVLGQHHLSRLENPYKDVFENKDINENFPLETLGKISSGSTPWDEMPQNVIQVYEIFDVWGIDFIGPFPSSQGNMYILVAVDYLSKWVKAKALPTNDARVVVKFLKSLFA
nr:reverse transcriptase domain-containing protein [Tanacetum cinerariifolium]